MDLAGRTLLTFAAVVLSLNNNPVVFAPPDRDLWYLPPCARGPPRQRVSANFSFFTTNYLMICATCSAVYILRSPGLLLTLLVSMCLFLYVFMSRRKTLVVLDVTLGTREKTIAAAAGVCAHAILAGLAPAALGDFCCKF